MEINRIFEKNSKKYKTIRNIHTLIIYLKKANQEINQEIGNNENTLMEVLIKQVVLEIAKYIDWNSLKIDTPAYYYGNTKTYDINDLTITPCYYAGKYTDKYIMVYQNGKTSFSGKNIENISKDLILPAVIFDDIIKEEFFYKTYSFIIDKEFNK